LNFLKPPVSAAREFDGARRAKSGSRLGGAALEGLGPIFILAAALMASAPARADNICDSISVRKELPSLTTSQVVEICHQMDQVLSGVTKEDVIMRGVSGLI
jgi:hypothetical protein